MGFNIFPKKLDNDQSQLELTAEQVRQKQFHDMVEDWSEETKHTPDLLKMERRVLTPFFIPDEVMTNKSHAAIIGLGGKMMHAFTKDDYFMLKKEENRVSSVVIFEEGQLRSLQHGMLKQLVASQQLHTAPVRGELHMLTAPQVIALDKYKENGVKFHRKRIDLSIPHRYKKQTEDGGLYLTPSTSHDYSAYLYFANYEQHFEHWHMTDLKRILASIPLIQAKVPYYYNL